MALGISQHRREEWCRPVDQRFLEALNRAKPDTLESFAAIWYRHNSEAGYYWEMLARHHYDHSRYHLLNLHAAFSLERPARTIEFRAFNGTPRRQNQGLHPAVPRDQRTGPDHQGRQPHAPGDRQPQVHLPVLAPEAGLHRRRV